MRMPTWLSSSLLSTVFISGSVLQAQELPPSEKVQAIKLFEVDSYSEGVVFDYEGRGYISWADTLTKFELDGKNSVFAKTGAPNGHKVLADGTHLVCDASQHAVLHLAKDGKQLEHASKECDGKPLRGPNDLTLDPQGASTSPTRANRPKKILSVPFTMSIQKERHTWLLPA